MSLRKIAKELGISPAYLSYMVNGKRPWREGIQRKYLRLVNTSLVDNAESVNRKALQKDLPDTNSHIPGCSHLHGVQGVVSSNLAAPTKTR